MMFNIPEFVTAYWKHRNEVRISPAQTFDARDFAEIETLWGYPLPESYKEFMSRYGNVEFPDEFSSFDFKYQKPDGFEMSFDASISYMKSAATLKTNRAAFIEHPDTDSGRPYFPRFMLPIAGNPDEDQILLELGSDTPRIWYWEDQEDAFGEGTNIALGFVADTLEDFINNLRPAD